MARNRVGKKTLACSSHMITVRPAYRVTKRRGEKKRVANIRKENLRKKKEQQRRRNHLYQEVAKNAQK